MTVDNIINGIRGNLANDGSVDYIQLTERIVFAERILKTILGVLVLVVLIGLPLIIAIELVYINFPIIRESDEKLLNITRGRIKKMLELTIRDARIAVERVNTVEYGGNANWVYLKIKSRSVLIAVMAVALTIGLGTPVIQFIVDMVAKILIGLGKVI